MLREKSSRAVGWNLTPLRGLSAFQRFISQFAIRHSLLPCDALSKTPTVSRGERSCPP